MAAERSLGKTTVELTPAFLEIPIAPILFPFNTLDTSIRNMAMTLLMKPKHLFHEIDKIFFFSRGLDSQHSRGIFSTLRESLSNALFQRFDTPASTVKIASSGDTHHPPRTPRGGPETQFGTVPNTAFFGWACPQLLRRHRAREVRFAGQIASSRDVLQSSEPSAFATKHSARFAGSRSTIARVTNQCRK